MKTVSRNAPMLGPQVCIPIQAETAQSEHVDKLDSILVLRLDGERSSPTQARRFDRQKKFAVTVATVEFDL